MKSRANYLKIMIKLSKKSNYNNALDIPTYLTDFALYDNNGHPIVSNDENTINLNNPSKVYTYIVPKSTVQISDDVYSIPIKFKAYSGNNSSFETKSGDPSPDMQYSNYKVEVTAGLLENKNGEWLPNSYKTDHVIYTNARIYSDIIQ